MHPATAHAASGTRRGSPPPRRAVPWPRLARHRRATIESKFRLPAPTGDPVACASGLFLEEHTDLTLPDLVPLALRRSYRQNDSNLRAFGIGAAHDLDQYLHFVNQSSANDGVKSIF